MDKIFRLADAEISPGNRVLEDSKFLAAGFLFGDDQIIPEFERLYLITHILMYINLVFG